MKKKTIGLSLIFYLGIIVLCIIMLTSIIYTIHIPDKQAERGIKVEHTREVISQLNLLEDHIYKLALANNTNSLLISAKVREQISIDLAILNKLTADNPAQQKNIVQLSKMIPPASLNLEKIIQQLDSMRHKEETLLIERQHTWRLALLHTKKIITISQFLLFTAILIIYQFFFSELAKRRKVIIDSHVEENRLHRIVALQNAITTSDLDINSVLKLVVDRTLALVNAEGSLIERVEGNELVYDIACGSGTPFLGMRVAISNSFSGKAVRQKVILKCDDAENDPQVNYMACKQVGLRSMLVVPLLPKGNIFGVLKVFSSKPYAFKNKDIDTMGLIAGLLSTRISDASSFAVIKDINRQLVSQKEELLHVNAELGELAVTDGLTGLYNHRYFMDKLNEEFRRAQRYKSIFSLVLIDVDHFKKFNDSYGHMAGDQVLRKVGAIMKDTSRDTDTVARYGGEEFSIILPSTGSKEAMYVAERLRADIAAAQWEHRSITISVGVSTFADHKHVQALLKNTDQALYAAKDAGRNCVRQWD